MVTITHQNRCAEMLATVRRGPFAKATPEERIEYLLTRVRKTNLNVTFADHALEHTLSSPVIVIRYPSHAVVQCSQCVQCSFFNLSLPRCERSV